MRAGSGPCAQSYGPRVGSAGPQLLRGPALSKAKQHNAPQWEQQIGQIDQRQARRRRGGAQDLPEDRNHRRRRVRAIDDKRYPEGGLVAIIQRFDGHEEERELEAYLCPDDAPEPYRWRALCGPTPSRRRSTPSTRRMAFRRRRESMNGRRSGAMRKSPLTRMCQSRSACANSGRYR